MTSDDMPACARRRRWWLTKLGAVICLASLLLAVFSLTQSLPSPSSNNGIFSSLRQIQSGLLQQDLQEVCPVTKLNPDREVPEDVKCHRLKPMKGSCKIAEELFHSQPIDTCNHQVKNEICQIKETSPDRYAVSCNKQICKSNIELVVTKPETGSPQTHPISSASDLEKQIYTLLLSSNKKQHFGFCIVRCLPATSNQKDSSEWDLLSDRISQLLILPPQINLSPLSNAKFIRKTDDFININIVMIDSLSHSHIYRSLPQTIKLFREINNGNKASVLDFELVQAIKSRTYESLEALFSAEINLKEKPFGTYDMPPKPLPVEVLLKPFKESGYRTLWLEDLCWTWEWGIVKDLVVHDPKLELSVKWERFQKALKKANIDAVDVTLSSCEILKENNKNDQFHGPPSVCYNGVHQHQYLLDYLRMYEKKSVSANLPYLSLYLSNIAHEDYGRRIQTFDEHFAKFLQGSVELENTLTIIFSDHGNTYGKFMESTLEGRIEMFHPILFMVLPNKVASVLGSDRMISLRENQHRLISLLDLHYTLRSLVPGWQKKTAKLNPSLKQFGANPDGLFSPIPKNRTCDNIPRLMPNLCICEGYDEPAENDSQHAVLAEFALGELNNLLIGQFRRSHPSSSDLGMCQRLAAHRFGNVREQRNSVDNTLITKLDLFVMAKDKSGQRHEEIFFITMKSSLGQSGGMKLLSFERMTPYSPFQACADSGVSLKLCVCSLDGATGTPQTIDDFLRSPPAIFDLYTSINTVDEENSTPCLHILSRNHKAGVVFEAVNVCKQFAFKLEFDLQVERMDLSTTMPLKVTMEPRMIRFLMAAKKSVKHKDFKWNYAVKYEGFSVSQSLKYE